MVAANRFVSVVCVFLLLFSSCSDKKPVDTDRHLDRSHEFSYVPPKGWIVKESPGGKYEVVVGPPSNEFAPNINFGDEAFDVSLEDYVSASLDVMEKVCPNYGKISQKVFRTAGGMSGIRVVTENEVWERKLRQTYYFFESDGKKYLATCSTLADWGEKLDALFDETMKTFKFEQ